MQATLSQSSAVELIKSESADTDVHGSTRRLCSQQKLGIDLDVKHTYMGGLAVCTAQGCVLKQLRHAEPGIAAQGCNGACQSIGARHIAYCLV